MNTATNVRKTTPESDTLTMEKIHEAMKLLPPPVPTQIFVLNRKTLDALREPHTSPTAHLDPIDKFAGIPVHWKASQRMNCWAFSDLKLARRYLDDEISEQDLVNILAGLITPEQAPASLFSFFP